MTTAYESFISRIQWHESATPEERQAILNTLNEILSTNAGATLYAQFVTPDVPIIISAGEGTIKNCSSYMWYEDETYNIVEYDLNFDFSKLGKQAFLASSGAVYQDM